MGPLEVEGDETISEEGDKSPSQEDFTPRDYQVELFQAALKENIIVYLPTGSGKTFIAALLIREHSNEVLSSLKEGGKRTVFLVPTVVLAVQQAAYLRRHTHLTVKEYYGSMGVDLWQKERWQTEFEENHVLVMTAQIFVDILNHAFFSVQLLNLLVFDECHAAVKDAPMKQVLEKLNRCSVPHRPKILGLTAALFRRRCKPTEVPDVIQELAETMGCVVKTPNDVATVYQNSTKPCEIIIQYGEDGKGQSAEARQLSEQISSKILHLFGQFGPRYAGYETQLGGEKASLLMDPLKELSYLLEAFGAYGVYHGAKVYCTILEKAKQRPMAQQFGSDLSKLLSLCHEIQSICTSVFSKHASKDRLLTFIQPRVRRLLELLRKFNPGNHDDGWKPKMCGIIFVERRCMANVLHHFLKEIRKHDESLEFVKPLFTMGQAAKTSHLRESSILNMKQKEIIRAFREGHCNLLVATSVLEEGVDVPACNLIIRFDKIKTYCDYVQTKGRARASKAFYCIMVGENDTEPSVMDLLQFHGIERKLSATKDFEEDSDSDFDQIFATLIEPYCPFGEDGPRVTQQGSISLVNRYCGKLSSESGLVLAPKWTMKEVREDQVDPEWLRKIRDLEAQLLPDTEESQLFECRIVLPLNSPLKEEVVSCVMPSQRLAKRSAALKTCVKLHELKELDDVHLFPRTKSLPEESFDDGDEDDDSIVSSGTPGQSTAVPYVKMLPECFTNCRPVPGLSSFVYWLNFSLIKPTSEGRKFYLPQTVDVKLALVSSRVIPSTCPFPLVTRAGEFNVQVVGVDSVVLSEHQLELLTKFHRFLFCDVIYLGKKLKLQFEPETAISQQLVVPLRQENNKIDFDFIEKMLNAPAIDWENKPTFEGTFQFDCSQYADAVVFPWYRPFGTLNAYYVDLVSNLTPLSPFPEDKFPNYAEYYRSRYDIVLTNQDQQRLLDVSRELTGKNFLVPRTLGPKETEKPHHLVPELCYLHPLPASVWKQVVWIPSVLHRLTGLLLAEELRVTINREARIGMEFLPGSMNVSSVWRPIVLRSAQDKCCPPVADPRILPHSFRPTTSQKKTDSFDPDEDQVWSVELSFSSADLNFADGSSGRSSPPSSNGQQQGDEYWQQAVRPTWKEEVLNLRFDSSSTSSVFGPSPGQVLEALTLSNANDGFDLERLETIGDSVLKLIISIDVFGRTGAEIVDEGHLTALRTQQINNQHLFQLGVKKNFGRILAAQAFEIGLNFLPPCFLPSEATGNEQTPDLRLHQMVSTKNIADSIEALIGLYLLSTGIKGAMTFMNWMGLKIFAESDGGHVHGFNNTNGFPIFRLSDPLEDEEDKAAIDRLFAGLDSFEKRLRYTFKDKKLLIEALTHPSYNHATNNPNRLTTSYQRLEFLGDAVLDYLVTRYFYESSEGEYSPAILTDLRSAMVSNETFAVIAVRHRFHTYLKYVDVRISVVLDQFVRSSEDNGHVYLHNYFVLEETSTAPPEQVACNVDVPKVLGDIFESVAGAIFIDSGMSLDAVWRSYLPFLHDALERFERKVPRSALRVLHERFPGDVKFKKSKKLEDGRVCVPMEIKGFGVFKGAGGNSRTAKSAAAKYALSELNKANHS